MILDLPKEQNSLPYKYFENPKDIKDIFNNIELYSSKFSGFGKTTEIKYKIKEKNAKYYYLPIGGILERNYIINNLENLNLDFKNSKDVYLHIDLSETDNDDLMNEVIFKLFILKFFDSNEKIYYLGYDINLIIEIPSGFSNFEEKYNILKILRKVYIDKLPPLRLEENAILIEHSPIMIVAEILKKYEEGTINKENINLEDPIRLHISEAEAIINRYITPENKNYYLKMNGIKILSSLFKKFTQCPYMNSTYNENPSIENARILFVKNSIKLTQSFTSSIYNSNIFCT